MNIPSVWQNHNGEVVLAVKSSPSTVHAITIIDQLVRDIKAYRIMEFLKDWKELNYCPNLAANKMLFGAIPCTSGAIKELKGIIAMSTTTTIVVTRTAEFIGRFVNQETAAKVIKDPSALIVTEPLALEGFTKKVLNDLLSKPHDETAMKNITKPQLAEQLFNEYLNKEFKMETKEKKESAVKSESAFQKIINRLHEGEVISLKSIIEDYDTTEGTARSIISNMRSEKYMKDNPIVPVISGKVDGEAVFFLEAFTPENLDAKGEKKAKVKADGEPRKKGLKTIIREALLEGPKTMEELLELTGVEKKLISDQLAYLKNPKYCGSEGMLNITRDPETKAYIAEVAEVVDPEETQA